MQTIEDTIADTLAARVTALREKKGWSQRKLAAECGVAQPTIANIERGRTHEVKGYVLEALAKALNTSTSYLLHGVEAKHDPKTAMYLVELNAIFPKLGQEDQAGIMRAARNALPHAPPKAPPPVPFLRLLGPTR